jgi:hypothetical protein
MIHTQLWVIDEDEDPEPWEDHSSPIKILSGSEQFAKDYIDRLGLEKPTSMFTYTGVNNEIEIEPTKD